MQPQVCVGSFVHYWVSCAIYKGGFFKIAFVSTHLPRFETIAYILPPFDPLTHVVICVAAQNTESGIRIRKWNHGNGNGNGIQNQISVIEN